MPRPWVATIGGNRTKIVCEHCYGILVHEQREKAKEAAKAGMGSVRAEQQWPGKAEPEQPDGKPLRLTASKKLRQLRASYLSSAGCLNSFMLLA